MSQKSILSYFSKVTKTPSPSTIVTEATAPKLSPASVESSSLFVTPRARPKSSTPKSRNGTSSKSSKKRAPDASEISPAETHINPKRRKTAESPSLRKKPTPRFKRILIQDDDDEDDKHDYSKDSTGSAEDDEDYKPDSPQDTTIESEGNDDSCSEEEDDSVEVCSEDEEDTPKNSKRKKKKYSGKRKLDLVTPEPKKLTPVRSATSNDKVSKGRAFLFETPVASPKVSKDTDGGRIWPHLTFPFLKADKIMDKNRRHPAHAQYDPKTLYVPKEFMDKVTPALRQWWEMKSIYHDTILFFKVGKFYELYHMDAVIAVEELGLIYMKGESAHCGFPEIAYSYNAEILVGRGYKVGRCEQTETPAMMEARTKNGMAKSKFDKVVRRELCQVTTKGIRLASALDGRSMPFHQNSEYLYGIVERKEDCGSGVEYGTCFIDTTIGTFYIAQFKDDRYCSRLRTLFSHNPPVQILYEKGKVSPVLSSLMENMGGVRKDALTSETEFWGAQKALKFLAEGPYFRNEESETVQWPESFKILLSKSDSLGLTPAEGWELGLKCLGSVVWFLSSCLVEHDILTLRQFETYAPIDLHTKTETEPGNFSTRSKFMVLDGSTLRNLEVTEGSKCLLSFLDNCSTNFGKRLLRYWTCVPLSCPHDIAKRQDAIEELMGQSDLIAKILPLMKSLLDLERLLGKIHTLGSVHRSQEHPDSRASFYEEKKYSKRKITDLVSVLKCFKTCVTIINTIRNSEVELSTDLLSSLISDFPSLDSLLKYFDEAFDHEAAINASNIQPVRGKVKDYDAAFEAIEDIQSEADEYLKDVRKALGVSKIAYFGHDKKRFQIEVGEKVEVGNEFDFSSSKKGFKRYTTKQTKAILEKMIAAEINREKVVKDITRRVFAQFDESRHIWSKAVKCISTLDVLISLTKFSKSHENMCRPRLVTSSLPYMCITDGRHPCVDPSKFIPNDFTLGKDSKGTFLLLTGANMGGKSTTMKQTGLIAILAHMGCYVPATSCEMSMIDRIFTRIGAADNIAEGESTFFVELSETSAILQHSSQHSLILMDELGRGTATHDGNAIAYAVAHALSQRGSRTIFSTHYHSLVSALKGTPSIEVGHMACMVEREDETDDDPTQEMITFLYKLTTGPCAKSYGFNAARIAGISDDVIRLAHRKAKEMEGSLNKLALCRKLSAKIKAACLTRGDTQLIPAI